MKNKVKTTKPKKKSIFVFFIKNIIKVIDKSIVMPISKFFDKISSKFNKNGNKLERFLVKKNTMIFLSLIIAIIIFFYVDSKSSVLVDSSAEVLRNQNVIATYNKEAYVVEGLPEEADVTLIGRRVDLYLAKQLSSGNVTVDISNLKPGTHKVDLNYDSSIKSVDYNLNPSSVTVVIYPKMSATKIAQIDVVNQDKLATKLSIQNVVIDQDEIIVKGAEHTLNEVASVKALVDINNIVDPSEGISKIDDVSLVAYDTKGNVVDVEMVPSKVSATVSIVSPKTTVPLKIIPKGEVEFGKAISSMTSSVGQVTVYGEETVIKDLQYIPVEVDVTKLSKTKTFNIVIEKPTGIRDISISNVNVTVSLGEVKEKVIDDIKIDPINLDSNYSPQSLGKNSSVTSVIVKGTESVLASIDSSTIKATVDLSGLGEGEHVVDVIVTGEDLRATYTAKPTKITVKIFKK
ncbi:MAG: CdaR family protein [Bacilli bacterium]|nr:CdaR family protein [Bacilli bacterium]